MIQNKMIATAYPLTPTIVRHLRSAVQAQKEALDLYGLHFAPEVIALMCQHYMDTEKKHTLWKKIQVFDIFLKNESHKITLAEIKYLVDTRQKLIKETNNEQ